MLYYRSIVVKQQLLPVGTKAVNLIAVGIGQVVGVGIQRSLTTVHILLVLQDRIVGSAGHVAVLPGTLPSVAEVVVNLSLTNLTLLGGH